MKLNKAYYFRLYPNKEDQVLLKKHFGSVRFIYNTMLRFKKFFYEKFGENPSNRELSYALTHLKKLEEYSWLNEVNSQTLQATLKDLDNAYKNFFEKRANFPKFKSKKTHKFSFRVPQRVFIVNDNRLKVPKFIEGIKVKLHREIIGTIKNATIKLNPSGKYYVSLTVEYDNQIPAKPEVNPSSATGLDLGIKTYATLSDGTKIFYPMYLERNLDKLKELQVKFSKSKSNRVRLEIAKLHEKITNQRLDFIHKLTKELVTKYDSIAIEDLDITSLLQGESKELSRRILDCSWFTFRQQLTYKANLYGCNLIVIPKYYPSSKSCSSCGSINNNLKLTDREYICPNCGLTLDRDYNASLNILNKGLEQA
jgi:transposase, IS605 orfB family|nr:MAG TPA: endonuclease [Caudoviricetes sp.]